MNPNRRTDKEQVRKDAKKIIDKFMQALEKVKTEEILKFGAERKECMRKPGDSKYRDTDFKERMLDNAPKKEDDQIVAKKKKW
ncbi:hypothetical protein GF371_01130 [Candidatus Woesearchaeota archaeon]|nr:hypothetical protein [Candidatus Woesearchaeota archaeon]